MNSVKDVTYAMHGLLEMAEADVLVAVLRGSKRAKGKITKECNYGRIS